METAGTINAIIQLIVNSIGFILFFGLLKVQIKKRDEAFDKIVEVVNGMLRRLDLIENEQKHVEKDIKEIKENYLVKYKP